MFDKIEERGSLLIRKKDPAYMDPTSRIGRAQLYAPHKNLGNWKIDTIWFNVLVIWVTSLLLYVMLYFDLLRKVLGIFENARIRKRSVI